jgi:hypothetical protein
LWPTAQEADQRQSGSPAKGLTYLTPAPKSLYPTPVMLGGGYKCRSGKRKGELTLGGLVSTYPTLQAQEAHHGHRGASARRTEKRIAAGRQLSLAEVSGPITSGPLSLTGVFAVRLATLSAWLMGYTAAYLAHWATQSSGGSRRKSSPPSKPQPGGAGE